MRTSIKVYEPTKVLSKTKNYSISIPNLKSILLKIFKKLLIITSFILCNAVLYFAGYSFVKTDFYTRFLTSFIQSCLLYFTISIIYINVSYSIKIKKHNKVNEYNYYDNEEY